MNKKIERFASMANYLAICQMYLKNIPSNEVKMEDLKDYAPGHWGCTPSVNFLYANLSYFAKNRDVPMQLIIGTGHAGCALYSDLFLSNKLDIVDPNIIIKQYGANIRTEINPTYPTTIYDGGELGYSLSNAYGIAITNDIFIPCIIGDGEAETGALMSSFQLNRMLNTKGRVLPIINLNGLKMSSASYLSRLNDSELNNFFSSFGYNVSICNTDNFYENLTLAYSQQNPLMIYKSIKGFGIPKGIAGTIFAHKDPLKDMDKESKTAFLNEWLEQYEKNSSIDSDFDYNHFKPELSDIVMPNIDEYKTSQTKLSNVSILNGYFMELIKNNARFLIFSPDELISNKFSKLLNYPNNVVEILNEAICECLLQGHLLSGGSGFIISYEAFMPIANTILSQYMKYLYELDHKRDVHSYNCLLTSTCWENNYSHQNPEFVSNVVSKEWDFVNAYYPKDANNLLKCAETCINSKNMINIITSSKGNLRQYDTINLDIEILEDCSDCDVVLVATGDYILNEVYSAYMQLKEKCNIRLVYVTNIMELKRLSEEDYKKYFDGKRVIYYYHGYASTIKQLMGNNVNNLEVFGYGDKSNTCDDVQEKLHMHQMQQDDICSCVYGRVKK